MEGFCGKNCDTCGWRETLRCDGCRSGPGRPVSGDCDIAACCRSKGHAQCGTCLLSGCGLRAGKDYMPERRQRKIEAERESRRRLDRDAPELGKWLWLLFWLFIPSEIAAVMTNENIVGAVPALRVPGEVLGIFCGAAYGLFLLKLAGKAAGYRPAGICTLLSAAFGLVTLVTGLGGEDPLWWVLALPLLVVELYGTYREFNAHADVLDGVDDVLSEKWRKLWKWQIGCLVGLFAGLLLVMIAGILGLLAVVAIGIAAVVVAVLKLVYLYRTAKRFREHIPAEREALPE